jgi:hypothetical protein
MIAMPNQPVSLPPQKTRKQSAEEINRAMARFPLIVQILDELSKEQLPLAGDADLNHGCQRALTGMLSELARIQPATDGKSSKAEETARSWLHHPDATRLVDADILQRMQQFIDRVLHSAR